ncbi:stage II sporulation protein P [Wansuia hejianensis]|uniref:Stage II sporulation protein P n=1 Tax=Wansuia hejianensis TaxID=2763667 RepID=A0A926F2K3_9FIRM|nr:stage II sporulation protein P [Wansuia hejianensis]MBC8590785.1 stage II sporulation protein P [Wansuia hejianensis]
MRRNTKSTYLIIALICLILLNLGSMTIIFSKNVEVFNKGQDMEFLEKIKSKLDIKENIRKILKNFKVKYKNNGNQSNKKGSIFKNENDAEELEDFIIINTEKEYEDLIIVKDNEGRDSIENIPEPLGIKKVKVNKEKPYIYIYHTHATESFVSFEKEGYRTTDNDKNIVAIGNTLTKVLEGGGHKVTHELTHHDRPSYNDSYTRSLNSINKAVAKEKNLKFLFDVHRDAIDRKSSGYDAFVKKSKVKINNIDTATFSLVVGPDSANYTEVLNFAKYIKAVSDTLYPGLCVGIIIKPYGRFNQYISDYSALIEIGRNVNTFEEVNESAKLIGEIMDIVIRSIQE